MYQTVNKIPTKTLEEEREAIIRAIPDLKNDINNLSKRMIYECALHHIHQFRRENVPSMRPQSYIERILYDLCRRFEGTLYRDEGNACQVLFAMRMIIRFRHTDPNTMETIFANNIREYLLENNDYLNSDWATDEEIGERISQNIVPTLAGQSTCEGFRGELASYRKGTVVVVYNISGNISNFIANLDKQNIRNYE